MGESLVEAPKVDIKMGESVTGVPCLQQSVSFGRFEHDSLSWERWSTFPTNKYLEEVEKYSKPGSVAQKKAYFEAHYKKIAAAKQAEVQMDQENKRETELVNSDDRIRMDSCSNISEEEMDNETASTGNSVDGTGPLENEVANCNDQGSVWCDVRSNGSGNSNQEVADLSGDVSEHTNGANQVTYVGNDASEVNEHIDEPNRVTYVVDNASEVNEHIDEPSCVTYVEDDASEVNEHVGELNDGAYVNDEVVKREVSEHIGELAYSADDSDNVNEVVKSEVTKHVSEPIDQAHVIVENPNTQPLAEDVIVENPNTQPLAEDVSEDLCLEVKNPELEMTKETVLVKEDLSLMQGLQVEKDMPQKKVEEQCAEQETENSMELVNPKKSQKATLVKKTTSTTIAKKKLASATPQNLRSNTPQNLRSTTPKPKSPMLSTPKSLKPELTRPAKPASRPSVKKENGCTPLTKKKTTTNQTKRVVPVSLHMSLSLGPAYSDPASLTTSRKSLIMERMGDKDIVKRAFKAFQNVTQVSPSYEEKPPATNQCASGKAEQKRSVSDTLRKRSEGIGRAAKTTSTHTVQQGTGKTLPSAGYRSYVGMHQRTATSVAASFGPRVQLQGNKPKEISKKLELSAKTQDFEKSQLQSKLKVEKAAHDRKPSQNVNSKPKLSSSYNQGHGFFKGSTLKEHAKMQASR